MSQKEIISHYGLTEIELREFIKNYVDGTPNVSFNWDSFLEYLKVEVRDKRLEYILPKDKV